jgi:hypothetical protein
MRRPAYYAAVIALAALSVWSAEARCSEVLNSTRETIIQGVRDDIRRKIQERRATPPQHEHRPEQHIPR